MRGQSLDGIEPFLPLFSSTPDNPLPLFQLKNYRWRYRAEGNANLVLALPDHRHILRIRKIQSDRENPILREASFCYHIIRPLLGAKTIHVPFIIQLPAFDVKHLPELLKPLRPLYRHHKRVFSDIAAILPDLSLPFDQNPTLCVEIKPKQGWIPLADRKLPKCTFCLNQFLKLRTGTVQKISQYCPLDLFSGVKRRMLSAVLALLSCPQNNFKVFLNGELIFGQDTNTLLEPILNQWFEGANSLENFCHVLVEALNTNLSDLTKTPGKNIKNYQKTQIIQRIPEKLLKECKELLLMQKEVPCYKPSQSLNSNSVLNRILDIQKLDVEGLDQAYSIYKSKCHADFGYLNELFCRPDEFDNLQAYLLAATARDCSILISFQKTNTGPYVLKDLNADSFSFNIGVSDLDPKPATCIEKHARKELDVIGACIELLRD